MAGPAAHGATSEQGSAVFDIFSRRLKRVQMRGGVRDPTEAYSCTPQGAASDANEADGPFSAA
jgi:hypothetical protein